MAAAHLPQVIDESAERNADAVAFRYADESITYGELVRRSNQLANVLVASGLRPGELAGIYMDKSLDTAVAVFGIQKAGGAYVPLDVEAPPARTGHLVRECRLRHIVSDGRNVDRLLDVVDGVDGIDAPVHVIGPETASVGSSTVIGWSEVARAAETAPSAGPTADGPAYVIFTSGSTGVPKGIVHTHESGLAYARMSAELYGLHAGDRLSNFPPLHFDQSTFDFFAGPLVGATTVIIGKEHQLVPASLSALIERERLTIWYSVPFALIRLLQFGVLAERDLSALRWVIYGGEPFPLKYLAELMELWPHARFSNCYGPAETNQCTYHHVDPLTAQELDADTGVPIGRGCPGVELRVVDLDDDEVAPGEPGELLISAPTTMQGYWEAPDLTAEAFRYRPASTEAPDRRFYRSGDLVRRGADGLLEFVGRVDRQVKSRGFRVELGEVEAVLFSHPDVTEVAVYPLVIDHVTMIQADLVLRAGGDVDHIRRHAASRLPAYAVPAQLGVRDRLPRSPNGKVDYRALAAGAAG
ncbi:MAG: amino acid adenylation domain-containing protein [Ilumatobacter sp.]|uniref:amino acid adenylation domain-containing protein n=1 Tax=Ilumatobacter sp. TaxID=1967498 RepID=UPI002606A2E9|nr:amino acid adenylation domain-containing protein [Ilumatobacter sp.]MDJ0767176.1 amino acid adenylation domain-containing protein [Ilumatobacter sp.]